MVRNCFFEQIGLKSELAKTTNAVAKMYGDLFTHQSDRSLPKTAFAKGIQQGKLMGAKFPSIILIIAYILHSKQGRNLLKQRKFCFSEAKMYDWLMLVETLLTWKQWLKLDQLAVKDVVRARTKHRQIMYYLQKIGKRQAGRGHNTMKNHGIIHISNDLLYFGVASEVDTKHNKLGHKEGKRAAKLTQKNEETFEF